VNHRTRSDLNASCEQLVDEAQRAGDADLARACDVICKYLRDRRSSLSSVPLTAAVTDLISPIKDYLALPEEARKAELEPFCEVLSIQIGAVEAAMPQA